MNIKFIFVIISCLLELANTNEVISLPPFIRQQGETYERILPVTKECFQGKNQNYKLETCAEDKRMCMTKLSISNGELSLEKSCQDPDLCLQEGKKNMDLCKSFDVSTDNVSSCHFCCIGDLCNSVNGLGDLHDTDTILSNIKLN